MASLADDGDGGLEKGFLLRIEGPELFL